MPKQNEKKEIPSEKPKSSETVASAEPKEVRVEKPVSNDSKSPGGDVQTGRDSFEELDRPEYDGGYSKYPSHSLRPVNLYRKLLAIRKKISKIEKGGVNQAQGYRYLSDEQIVDQLKPIFDLHHVLMFFSAVITNVAPTPSGKQNLTTVRVEYRFIDADTGEQTQTEACYGQGSDSNDKGVYKAITGAIKYIYVKTLMIPTGDDPENERGGGKKKEVDYDRPPFGEGSAEED